MSRARRALFAVVGLVLAVAIVEALSWIALAALREEAAGAAAPSSAEARGGEAAGRRDGAQAEDAGGDAAGAEALDAAARAQRAERRRYWAVHPYAGYVAAPGSPVEFGDAVPGLAVNAYGFVDTAGPLRERAPDRVVVAVAGGSVAERFGLEGTAAFESALARDPRYAGKRVEWVRLGLSGWKQPQPLTAIAYLLADGAQIDVLLEIDGFNEIALPRIDLVSHGVAAIFPRYWKQQTAPLPDAAMLRRIAEIERLEHRLDALLEAPSGALRFSGLARLVALVRARRLDAQVARAHADFAAAARARADGAPIGPYREYASRVELAEHLVGIWARSSLGLHALSRTFGFRYVHVLQPNPHVPDTKPLSESERALVADATMLYRDDARDFHPLLQRAGRELAASGVEFVDATRAFEAHPETLYVDSCCHFGPRGNEILAELVAGAMRERDPQPRDARGVTRPR
ncbi:MAG: hypothetical protein R3E88_20710 [Myxococcota bacterium]